LCIYDYMLMTVSLIIYMLLKQPLAEAVYKGAHVAERTPGKDRSGTNAAFIVRLAGAVITRP